MSSDLNLRDQLDLIEPLEFHQKLAKYNQNKLKSIKNGQQWSKIQLNLTIFDGFCRLLWISTNFDLLIDIIIGFNKNIKNITNFNLLNKKLVDLNLKLVRIDQKSTSSFNQNPIFGVRFELDKFWCLNSDALKSESSTFDLLALIA